MNDIRTGQGFDVHRLLEGRKLILCGVEIPYKLGLDGHSDADVAVHAVMDAVLGALALGDIGQWFPDTDAKYRGADSMKLLSSLLSDSRIEGWKLNNLDIIIIAQQPKIAPFMDEMRRNLAGVFKCSPDRVSVKATTTEKLGFCGRGEGIAASAVVLLTK